MSKAIYVPWLQERQREGKPTLTLRSNFMLNPKRNAILLEITRKGTNPRTVGTFLSAEDIEWFLQQLHLWKRENSKAESAWNAKFGNRAELHPLRGRRK